MKKLKERNRSRRDLETSEKKKRSLCSNNKEKMRRKEKLSVR